MNDKSPLYYMAVSNQTRIIDTMGFRGNVIYDELVNLIAQWCAPVCFIAFCRFIPFEYVVNGLSFITGLEV